MLQQADMTEPKVKRKRKFDKALLDEYLVRDEATLVGEYEELDNKTIIKFKCICGKIKTKPFNLIVNTSGAYCDECSEKHKLEKRIETKKNEGSLLYTEEKLEECFKEYNSNIVKIFYNDLNILNRDTIVEFTCKCGKNDKKVCRSIFYRGGAMCTVCTKNVAVEKQKKTNLEIYGFENALQNKEIKNKMNETIKIRYGVNNISELDTIKEKKKQTTLQKYGVEHPSQVESIKDKKKETTLKNYGVEHPLYSDIVKNKIKETNKTKYGVEYVSQNKEIQQKTKDTNLKKYGVTCPIQNEIISNKIKENNIKNYGVENVLQSESVKNKIKETNIIKYGVENTSQTKEVQEKIKKTNMEKYGVPTYMNLEKVKEHTKVLRIKKYIDEKISIRYTHPEICKEWDTVKNNEITTEMVINGSNMKVWWICPTKKHSYKSSINSRCKMNSGCPLCINKTEAKLLEFLIKYYTDVFTQLKLDNCKNIYRLRFDFCIPSLKIIIELDGMQHFKQVSNWASPEETLKNDIYKMKKAEAEGYKIIRIFQEDVYNNDESWLETNLLPKITSQDRNHMFISNIDGLYHEHIRVYENSEKIVLDEEEIIDE